MELSKKEKQEFIKQNKTVDFIFYDVYGKETENQKKACAKKAKNFYIKTYKNRPYNPSEHSELKRLDEDRMRWVKVKEDIFTLYFKFLTTGKTMYLTQVRREILL